MPNDEELYDEEIIDGEEETEKPSWSERRKARKKEKQIAKTESLKQKIEEEKVKTELMKQRNELRQLRRESEPPAVKNTKAFAKELMMEGSRSFGKTARYMRDTGRARARRSTRGGYKRVQRVPAVMRQTASVPTGLEAGIMMEFQKPPRQDMFTGGQGNIVERGTQQSNIVERGTQQVNIVERGSQPTVQTPRIIQTTRPVIVREPQPQQQDFFGKPGSMDFFGNQRDILGSQKNLDFGFNKKKKQKFF